MLFRTFHFGTEVMMRQKFMMVGWSGFGMATDRIHPFQVHNGHPTDIPPKRILGRVL